MLNSIPQQRVLLLLRLVRSKPGVESNYWLTHLLQRLTPATHSPAPMESYTQQFTQFTTAFPLWQYLTQRLFDQEQKLVINPRSFAKNYRVDFLEYCFSMVSESSNPGL